MAEQPNDPRVELERIVNELDHRRLDGVFREKEVSHTKGPMFWLRRFTATENYQWQAQGREAIAPFPHKPFPPELLGGFNIPPERKHWDYLDHIMQAMLAGLKKSESDKAALYIPKTREMMTSWLVVAFITWHCQFFPATGWLAQSEKDDKAQGLINYANILYKNQPAWLRDRHPLKRGADEGTKHRVDWANGSWFKALAQGARQSASDHPHGWFNDESAHQPTWKAALNITRPAVKQIICVSSAATSDFGIACEPPAKAV